MSEVDIKEVVRERYAEIARNVRAPGSSCCYDGESGSEDGALGHRRPAAVEGSDIEKERAFVTAFKFLKNRISVFISLPIRSLDKMALGAKLQDIGRIDGATPRATS
jgi:hypothetical protein